MRALTGIRRQLSRTRNGRVHIGISLLAAAVPLAGCGAGERAAAGPAMRDSAGVAIVENRAAAWTEADRWRVGPEPSVDIGMLDGPPEYQLYRVVDALRLEDGRIVVANAGTHQLRYYDAGGRHLASVGGEGDGPGEFGRLTQLDRLPGDSIVVYDSGHQRLAVYDPEGRFVRTVRIEPAGGQGFYRFLGRLDDGTFLFRTGGVYRASGTEVGLHRHTALYFRNAADGTLVDTLGTFPGSQAFVRREGGNMSVISAPFGRSTVAAVQGTRVYVGTQDVPEVAVYSPEGTLVRLIRWARPPREVTAADIENYRAERLGNAAEQFHAMLERMLADVPYPETWPAHAALNVDEGGNMWVQANPTPGEGGSRWTVFDTDGRMLGVVELPAGLTVLQIGSDFVLGRWRDELEVEHVRLYELIKPGAAVAES